MSNDNVISLTGKTATEIEAEAPAPRIPNVFEFYKIDGELLASVTGFLNLAPDFAAVIDNEGDVVFVVQASGYSYVKNIGPAQASA